MEKIQGEREHLRAQENTLWVGAEAHNPEQPPRFAYDELGLTFASPADIPNSLRPLLKDLNNIAQKDSSLTVVLPETFHFTFFAVSCPKWHTEKDVPQDLLRTTKQQISSPSLKPWDLTDLRLVPLKNSLLIAGIPCEKTLHNRGKFAADFLKTTAADSIKERHTGLPIPPLLYHAVILRYEREALSPELQTLYHRYKEMNFGDISLETPQLYLSNLNFSKKERVRES